MIESRSSSRIKSKIEKIATKPNLRASTNSKPKSKEPAKLKPRMKKSLPNKVQKTLKAHPSTSNMVNVAIQNLDNRRHGSSLQAIKKYVYANYQLDPVKTAPLIRRYLKKAVSEGTLVQTKGQGSNGSFKMPGKKNLKK
ncbi:histone H1B-like [Cotesia glomerata]|uniref:histone H1B-like n=1 Tax=Cotesia glomerata TaxID=32391 RepID=UPI001D01E71D|nr:histone H1B-like [Cotesia glomerata]